MTDEDRREVVALIQQVITPVLSKQDSVLKDMRTVINEQQTALDSLAAIVDDRIEWSPEFKMWVSKARMAAFKRNPRSNDDQHDDAVTPIAKAAKG